jgi:branched-chain amino acid transport system substrate-binding protein
LVNIHVSGAAQSPGPNLLCSIRPWGTLWLEHGSRAAARAGPAAHGGQAAGHTNQPTTQHHREETMVRRTASTTLLPAFVLAASLTAGLAHAQKSYGPGVTDTEIRIGQTMPYSGPASAYGVVGKAEAALFAKVNEEGGINGRKIKLVSLDDGYSPPRTVEQTRKLVEEEQVLFIYSSLGTPPNTAIQKYLNAKRVPQLFVSTGATKWGDPQHFPWTMGWQPYYQAESRTYAAYILKQRPNAKIGILFQNDDYGKDYVKGFKDGLGDKAASMIVAEVSYEVTDPTVDSQIVTLQASGADTFFNVTTPKFAAQAIRKAYDTGWKPVHFLNLVSASIASVLQPAGLEKAIGLISAVYQKDPSDPEWKSDRATQAFFAWAKKYLPDADPTDPYVAAGYSNAHTLLQALKQCGDELTRENIMRQAANLRNVEVPMLLPGILINTGPADFFPIEQLQLQRFDGKNWVRFGDLIDATHRR